MSDSTLRSVEPIQGETADRLSEKLGHSSLLLGDVADVMSGLAPFEPQNERPPLNALTAFTGEILQYEAIPGPLGFIRYDKRLTEFRPLRCFSEPRLLLNSHAVNGRLACAAIDETLATGSHLLTIIPREQNRNQAWTFDKEASFVQCPGLIPVLLGFLNSRIATVAAGSCLGKGLSAEEALELPLPALNPMNRRHRALQGQIVSAVYRLSYLCRERRSGKPAWANRVVDRQIEEADIAVEGLFAQAFDLDDAEKALLGIVGGK